MTEEELYKILDEFGISPDYPLYKGYLPDAVTRLVHEIYRLRHLDDKQ